MQQETAPGTRRWRLGCLALFIGLLIVGGGFGLGGYALFRSQVKMYTADVPVELPSVDLPKREMQRLRNRLKAFQERAFETPEEVAASAELSSGTEPGDGLSSSNSGSEPNAAVSTTPDRSATVLDAGVEVEPTWDLILTANEINAVINSDRRLKGKAFITIEDGRIHGEVSIPADMLPGGEGRFLNAKGFFDCEVVDGKLDVKLSEVEVKGEKVSDTISDTFSKELGKRLNGSPQNASLIRRLDAVLVQDDKIILKLRRQVPESTPQEPMSKGT